MAKVNPSQRLNDKPHKAWIGVNKRTCAIVTAHCTCMAGYANNQKFCLFCAFVYVILTYVIDSEKSVLMLLVCFSKSKPVLGLELHDGVFFCVCQETVYGDMVACGGPDCPYEWLHFEYVGLSKEPLGEWYCSECRDAD